VWEARKLWGDRGVVEGRSIFPQNRLAPVHGAVRHGWESWSPERLPEMFAMQFVLGPHRLAVHGLRFELNPAGSGRFRPGLI